MSTANIVKGTPFQEGYKRGLAVVKKVEGWYGEPIPPQQLAVFKRTDPDFAQGYSMALAWQKLKPKEAA